MTIKNGDMPAMQQFPREALMLTPQFKLKKVTVTGASRWSNDYLELSTGKNVPKWGVFATERDAVEFGILDVERQRQALQKKLDNLAKKEQNILAIKANLDCAK